MNNALVSIIIPAFNRVDLTVKTVESILGQTYDPVEIIVVDDGSTDDTRQRMAAFGDRIQYVYKKNGGASSARNAGFRLSQGVYIGFIDCDDLYTPEKITRSVAFLEENRECGFVHTDAYYRDSQERGALRVSQDRARYQGNIAELIFVRNLIVNPTVLIRRGALEAVGVFDEALFPPADWDLWLRLAERFPVGYIAEPLSHYRMASNWNFRNVERTREEELIVIKKYLDRNPQTSAKARGQAYARHHVTFAKMYAAAGDDEKAREELRQAIIQDRFGIRTNTAYWGFKLMRPGFKAMAKKSLSLMD